MSEVKVLKSLVLGIPLAVLVQYFYWMDVLAFMYEDISLQSIIFYSILVLVFCVVEEYIIFNANYNWKEKLPLDITWVICIIIFFLYVCYKATKGYMPPPGSYDVAFWDLNYVLIFGFGVYLFVLYIYTRVGLFCIKEIIKWKKNGNNGNKSF